MIVYRQIATAVTAFVTQHLLDIAGAYQTECSDTLSSIDIPADTIEAISWLKYDRLARVAGEYVQRLETNEVIRLEVDLLTSITEEVSAVSPFSKPLAGAVSCSVHSSGRAYQDDIYGTLTAIIAALVNELRAGTKILADKLGVPTELAWKLSTLHAEQCPRVAQVYSERVCFKQFFLMNLPLLQKEIRVAYNQAEEEQKLDRFILHGGSNSLMKELFKARPVNLAVRRQILALSDQQQPIFRKIRRADLCVDERHEIFELWVSMLDKNPIDRYLAIAEKTQLKITVIQAVVKEIESEPFGQSAVHRLNQCA